MYYNGVEYIDDNGATYHVNTYISNGDWDRLSYVGQVNNLQYNDPTDLIQYVIREYCKEHDILNRMSQLTGRPHKSYEDYLAYINGRL